MTYETPSGERFALTYWTPADWADYIVGWFLRLGCSAEYAQRAAQKYREAGRP